MKNKSGKAHRKPPFPQEKARKNIPEKTSEDTFDIDHEKIMNSTRPVGSWSICGLRLQYNSNKGSMYCVNIEPEEALRKCTERP